MKAVILFHSISGHSYDLAQAIAEGVRSVPGCAAEIFRVYDPYTDDELKYIQPCRETFAHVPVASWGDISPVQGADAIIVGGPVYFGQISSPVYDYLQHTTAPPWLAGTYNGKAAAAFASCASQNGGAEEAIRNMHTTLMHYGMVIVPFPNNHGVLEMRQHDVPIGGTSYGASAANGMGPTYRRVNDMEKSLARQHGAYIARVALALKRSKELFVREER